MTSNNDDMDGVDMKAKMVTERDLKKNNSNDRDREKDKEQDRTPIENRSPIPVDQEKSPVSSSDSKKSDKESDKEEVALTAELLGNPEVTEDAGVEEAVPTITEPVAVMEVPERTSTKEPASQSTIEQVTVTDLPSVDAVGPEDSDGQTEPFETNATGIAYEEAQAIHTSTTQDSGGAPEDSSGTTAAVPPCYMDKEKWNELEKELFFHGMIPMEDVASMLKKDGEFLLRKVEDDNGFCAPVITVVTETKVKSFSLLSKKEDTGKILYTVDGTKFKRTPLKIIRYHHKGKNPIFGSIRLVEPVTKQEWELSKEQLKMVRKIGEGAFGEVWFGLLDRNGKSNPVAIKLMNMTANTKVNLEKMHIEARIHRQYNHGHVVRLFGILFTDSDVRIVMEMVDGGSLEKHLQRNKGKLGALQKASFCYDVASGLAYLHGKKCMHRDIAARNCLIGNNGKWVKVSDFGLSVQGTAFKLGPTEKVPVRWQSPEVLLNRVYYTSSDVWSYGMLVWEIHNDGLAPFTGIPNKEIRAKINDPTFRPKLNFKSPYSEILTILRLCWQHDYRKRPAMKIIEDALRKYSVHPLYKQDSETVVVARQAVNLGTSSTISTTSSTLKTDKMKSPDRKFKSPFRKKTSGRKKSGGSFDGKGPRNRGPNDDLVSGTETPPLEVQDNPKQKNKSWIKAKKNSRTKKSSHNK